MTAHRWAWAEIDLNAIRANVDAFRALVSEVALEAAATSKRVPKTPRIMAVVKADAYGHGAVTVARAALAAGASWLGVATPDEALELREAGITAPLLLLSEPPETALPELVAANVTCTAGSLDFLHTLSGYGMLNNEEITYHLKVDTGMNRIGVRADQAVSVLREAAELPKLKLGGVFTHFATADSALDWDAQQQLERFQGVLRRANDIGIKPPVVHAANTAATMLMPGAHFDMVRIGIGLYGLHPSDDTRKVLDLTPAMSVRARATLVKPLAMGEGVGYGLTWRAVRPVHLATLPLGYADGIPRLCSNKMDVLIGLSGKRIEQVGNVCMDQMMAAASPADGIQTADEFVLMGAADRSADTRDLARAVRDHTHRKIEGFIPADEIAEQAETITYELVCGLGQRLEKVYLNA